ncbi:hypothetical protein KIW84_055284 [Lathyrus oleraceus]|uniref:Uncharacterized protein n=1 Tax=Pisum sativum TaxID=3888 RepID=A0A9D4WYB5_PEA|nr:hypothetical protein KIW84_055284 [Pisum sativum]
MPTSIPVISVPPHLVHTLPHVKDTIYHSESSEDPDVYEKMDEMKDQFLELRKELKTLELQRRCFVKCASLHRFVTKCASEVNSVKVILPRSAYELKFVKNGKLVIVGGEKALLVSHLSSFSYIEAEDEVGTPFQALSIAAEKRVGAPMSLLKDAQKIVEEGNVDQGGICEGFIHGNEEHLAVVLENDEVEDCTNFVTHGKACNN